MPFAIAAHNSEAEDSVIRISSAVKYLLRCLTMLRCSLAEGIDGTIHSGGIRDARSLRFASAITSHFTFTDSVETIVTEMNTCRTWKKILNAKAYISDNETAGSSKSFNFLWKIPQI